LSHMVIPCVICRYMYHKRPFKKNSTNGRVGKECISKAFGVSVADRPKAKSKNVKKLVIAWLDGMYVQAMYV
jgi:hypothetical protein